MRGSHQYPAHKDGHLASFGVRLPAPLLPLLPSDNTFRGQTYAEIAPFDAVTVQLAQLPGFGPKKARQFLPCVQVALPRGYGGTAAVSSASAPNSVTVTTSAPAVTEWQERQQQRQREWTNGLGRGLGHRTRSQLSSPGLTPVRGDAPSRRLCEAQESPLWDICQMVTGCWAEEREVEQIKRIECHM